jgi:hypothetical protein
MEEGRNDVHLLDCHATTCHVSIFCNKGCGCMAL